MPSGTCRSLATCQPAPSRTSTTILSADVAGERGQDPVEHRCVHRVGQEPDDGAGCWPDEAENIDPLEALVPASQRALTLARPDLADDRLEAGAMFIEGPHLDRPVRLRARQLFHAGAEVGLEPLLGGKVALCVARPRHLPGEPQAPQVFQAAAR